MGDTDNNEAVSYTSLKENPEALLWLLNKHVTVNLVKNVSFTGFIDSIDPITYSIILSIPKEDNFQTTIIPGHAIQTLQQIQNSSIKPPTETLASVETESDIIFKRKNIIAWFQTNYLPVTEDKEDIIVGGAKVLPPYSELDIYAKTPVVALQIRKIMEKMPLDFVPK